jgi:hypothetical protein
LADDTPLLLYFDSDGILKDQGAKIKKKSKSINRRDRKEKTQRAAEDYINCRDSAALCGLYTYLQLSGTAVKNKTGSIF